MVPSKIQTPSSSHLVKKFSANVQPLRISFAVLVIPSIFYRNIFKKPNFKNAFGEPPMILCDVF